MKFIHKTIKIDKWVIYFLILFFIYTVTIFGLNYVVDPFGNREWVCKNRYKPVVNERFYKYNQIFYNNDIQKYDSLILGSSRVMQIIPSHFKEDKKVYNFGVHVCNNAEKLFVLKTWLEKKELKNLYLGIDLHNFSLDDNIGMVNKEKFLHGDESNYFSFDAFKLSLKSLNNQFKNKAQVYVEQDGELNYLENETLIKQKKFDFTNLKMKRLAQEAIGKISADTIITSNKAFQELIAIKKLSTEYDFNVIAFITPLHNYAYDLLENQMEIQKKYSVIKNELVHIFGQVYDFNIQHDFNDINENFYDIVHYRPQLGDKIIEALEQENYDYGLILHNNETIRGD